MLEFGLALVVSTLELLVVFSYKTRQFSYISIRQNKIHSFSLLIMVTTSSSREKRIVPSSFDYLMILFPDECLDLV